MYLSVGLTISVGEFELEILYKSIISFSKLNLYNKYLPKLLSVKTYSSYKLYSIIYSFLFSFFYSMALEKLLAYGFEVVYIL